MPTPSSWSVYVLIDPRTDEVRYVGVSVNPYHRLSRHIRDTARETTRKANWIKQLLSCGLRPEMQVVEQGDDWQLRAEAEKRWIAHYREQGARLTNLTDGGDGVLGHQWTEEQRVQIRGRLVSEEARKKISRSKKGRPIDPKHHTRLLASHTGKPLSEEHKQKIAAAHQGRVFSEESRQRMLQAQRQRRNGPMSEEHKRKIADAHKGKPGTPWTDEHRRKVMEARRRRRENNE